MKKLKRIALVAIFFTGTFALVEPAVAGWSITVGAACNTNMPGCCDYGGGDSFDGQFMAAL